MVGSGGTAVYLSVCLVRQVCISGGLLLSAEFSAGTIVQSYSVLAVTVSERRQTGRQTAEAEEPVCTVCLTHLSANIKEKR